MSDEPRQIGGRKEAPLAIVGTSNLGLQSQQEQVYTPNDPEYHNYQTLLRGYFEKFTRWQEILTAEECQENDLWRGFSVFRSDDGLFIKPGTTWVGDDPPNKILQVRVHSYIDDPKRERFGKEYIIRSGQEGKHLLIDPDGEPLEMVRVNIGIQGDKYLAINTERLDITQDRRYYAYRQADYRFYGDTLEVSHQYSWYDVMTDEMATNLINTIDALIPRAPVANQQPERRASQETQTLKAFPPARIARLPGR